MFVRLLLMNVRNNIKFDWHFIANLSSLLYKPIDTFCHFTFNLLLTCTCNNSLRLAPFLHKSWDHVMTYNTDLIVNSWLLNEIKKGLNHIPTKKPNLIEAYLAIEEVWFELVDILCFSTKTTEYS
ncbi:hypothetical protein O6H91_08G013300 [Diphasiastrum complanatum]|uniref:Uncharacterized protein n=1 Tax=Diphasiastrum complanatum TaxID=34168 RepID=A0ACC2CUY7_DIPCM|nr:hypothetical protein O6H91_08G013300 [Diphasiastrum complanatum]